MGNAKIGKKTENISSLLFMGLPPYEEPSDKNSLFDWGSIREMGLCVNFKRVF
jgi:hypothetical protein